MTFLNLSNRLVRRYSACLLLASLVPMAKADVSREQLKACYQLSDSLLRLQCYEQLTLEQLSLESSTTNQDPETAPLAAKTSPVVEEPVPEPAVPDSQLSNVPSEPATLVPQSEPAQVKQQKSLATAGSEYLRKPPTNKAPQSLEARVTKVEKDARGRLWFHFENGQIWRQLEKAYVKYPKSAAFLVTLNQGMMEDYRLRVEGQGRMVRVKRIK